jgi:pyruvate dehydrogenase E1 component alpha subunit
MFSRAKKFFGGHGIVGANIAIGTGLAFAHHYLDDGGVCVAYMGDGALNQGQVYESFNMAALWKLPVLYILENNGYSMGTSVERACANPNQLYNRGIGYGIPGEPVNGMDVLAVREAAMRGLDYVRAGNGPMLLEMKTYRYRGHSMSDPAKYRSKEEVEHMRQNEDPIERLQRLLLENGAAEEELKGLEKGIKEIVSQSVEFSENSSEPDPSELYTDILIES